MNEPEVYTWMTSKSLWIWQWIQTPQTCDRERTATRRNESTSVYKQLSCVYVCICCLFLPSRTSGYLGALQIMYLHIILKQTLWKCMDQVKRIHVHYWLSLDKILNEFLSVAYYYTKQCSCVGSFLLCATMRTHWRRRRKRWEDEFLKLAPDSVFAMLFYYPQHVRGSQSLATWYSDHVQSFYTWLCQEAQMEHKTFSKLLSVLAGMWTPNCSVDSRAR